MDIDKIVPDAEKRMKGAVDATSHDFSHIRTGRANPSILEDVKVDYYGVETPITQVANISVPEPRQLLIAPYEKNLLGPIEKAIQTSDLGVNPNNDGTSIRLNFPQMTEERRKELVKQVAHRAEEGKAAIRNVRKDALNHIRQAGKNKEVSEDDEKMYEKDLQEITDKYIAKIDSIEKRKEEEVMEV
ncbi:MAG: ribosome recycling factor [Fimbriimonadaceae bacterium]